MHTYIVGKLRYKNNSNKIGRRCDKRKLLALKDLPIENINLDRSGIYTDKYCIYSRVNKLAKHKVANHGQKEYVGSEAHTNSV